MGGCLSTLGRMCTSRTLLRRCSVPLELYCAACSAFLSCHGTLALSHLHSLFVAAVLCRGVPKYVPKAIGTKLPN